MKGKKASMLYFNSTFRATLWNANIKFRMHPHLEKRINEKKWREWNSWSESENGIWAFSSQMCVYKDDVQWSGRAWLEANSLGCTHLSSSYREAT